MVLAPLRLGIWSGAFFVFLAISVNSKIYATAPVRPSMIVLVRLLASTASMSVSRNRMHRGPRQSFETLPRATRRSMLRMLVCHLSARSVLVRRRGLCVSCVVFTSLLELVTENLLCPSSLFHQSPDCSAKILERFGVGASQGPSPEQ